MPLEGPKDNWWEKKKQTGNLEATDLKKFRQRQQIFGNTNTPFTSYATLVWGGEAKNNFAKWCNLKISLCLCKIKYQ